MSHSNNVRFGYRVSLGASLVAGMLAGLVSTSAFAVDEGSRVIGNAGVVVPREEPRVRIGLVLTPYREMRVQERDGRMVTRHIPDQPRNYTLRARANEVNHFYIGDYHVETQPLSYSPQTKAYAVRVGVWQRFGDEGSIEEKVGHTDVAGTLSVDSRDRVYVLNGVSTSVFRNGHGQPLVAVAAGFGAPPTNVPSNIQPTMLSRDATAGSPGAK